MQSIQLNLQLNLQFESSSNPIAPTQPLRSQPHSPPGPLVALHGGLQHLPELLLTSVSALEHLGEPPSSSLARRLRGLTLSVLLLARGLLTPMAALSLRSKLRQLWETPTLRPRKAVTALMALTSLSWLSLGALLKGRRAGSTVHANVAVLGSPFVARIRSALFRQARRLQTQAVTGLMATSLGLLYILGPCAAALITAGLVRAKSPSVRVMLLTKLAALTTLSRWRLPKANDALMRRLFIDSGIFRSLQRYFSFKLIEEAPLDGLSTTHQGVHKPKLLAAFPHGVVPVGVVMLRLAQLERNLPATTLGASVIFALPILRQALSLFGVVPATAQNLQRELRRPPPQNRVVVTPGGIAEMFLTQQAREVVLLARRKGFCRHALQAGADLVPVYFFGHSQLYHRVGSGPLGAALQDLSRALRMSLLLAVGASWLSPIVPLQKPITVVVGRPIHVAEPIESPSQEQVDELHARFCVELRRIFERYKGEHSADFAQRRLYFEDEALQPEDEALERTAEEAQRREQFHIFPQRLSSL